MSEFGFFFLHLWCKWSVSSFVLQAFGSAKPYGSSRSIVRRIATSLPLKPCPRVHFQVRERYQDHHFCSIVSLNRQTRQSLKMYILYFKIMACRPSCDFMLFGFVTYDVAPSPLLSLWVTAMWRQITHPLPLLFTSACLTVFIYVP